MVFLGNFNRGEVCNSRGRDLPLIQNREFMDYRYAMLLVVGTPKKCPAGYALRESKYPVKYQYIFILDPINLARKLYLNMKARKVQHCRSELPSPCGRK